MKLTEITKQMMMTMIAMIVTLVLTFVLKLYHATINKFHSINYFFSINISQVFRAKLLSLFS